MADKKPKVLFTFVEAGMGHIIPMTGMANAFEKAYGDKCEVVRSYIFSESKHPSVKAMGEELCNHTKHTMSSWTYNKIEALSYLLSSKATHFILDTHFKKPRKDFFEEFKEINPDLIVSTYYKPAHLAAQSNKKGLTDCLIATYTPDPYIYPAWDRDCDIYMVNNSVAKEMAIKKGFKKEAVKQIPFIFKDNVTGLTLTKEQALEDLGIADDRFTVLFTSGAYGAKDTEKLIYKLLKANLKMNLVVVCGKSQEMLDAMNELNKIKGDNTNFYIIGFTDKLAEYMRAADLVIGKSGMNTIMEAVYLDCPVIINAEANRLEEMITKFCLKEKLAIRETKPDKIVKIVENCINDNDYLSEYKKNFEKYKDPSGGEEAAKLLFELLKTRFPEL